MRKIQIKQKYKNIYSLLIILFVILTVLSITNKATAMNPLTLEMDICYIDDFIIDFNYTPKNSLTNDEIIFTDTSTYNNPRSYSSVYNGTYTYNWDFGDGAISNLRNPTHKYTVAGIYQVKFTINEYEKSYLKTKVITVQSLNNPSILFEDSEEGNLDEQPNISEQKQNRAPVAIVFIDIDEDIPIVNASLSIDEDNDPLLFRWDFNNDGLWDTDYTTDTKYYLDSIDNLGTEIRVEVFDSELSYEEVIPIPLIAGISEITTKNSENSKSTFTNSYLILFCNWWWILVLLLILLLVGIILYSKRDIITLKLKIIDLKKREFQEYKQDFSYSEF